MENGTKRLVAVLSDLMFTVKIQEAAKRSGLEAVFVRSKQEALEAAATEPAVIIVDLNHAAADPLELIAELKSSEQTREVRLLGYVSHVQADLKQAAQQKGCDVVMPRSAFALNLRAILRRYAEA